jgi:beta-ketoacyl ACP synthase
LPVRIGGHLLEDFDEQLTRMELRRFLFLPKISTVVGRRVWANAGSPEVDTDRLMVSIGIGMGSTEEFVWACDDIRERGVRTISPVGVLKAMPNAAAAAVGLERGPKAWIFTPVAACSSRAEGIARAWRNIVLGEADIAICGGVETKIEAVPIAAFTHQHLLSTNNDDPAGACRPFDKERDGFVFGEAGALMVIPPTLNLRALDPEIDLDVVAGEPRTGDYRCAVSNSFGFGGYNVALAFGKY